jgi:hypothetical protein
MLVDKPDWTLRLAWLNDRFTVEVEIAKVEFADLGITRGKRLSG